MADDVPVDRPTDAEVALAFDDVTVDFGDVRALDGVSGRLVGTGITGLAGANGAGKTTLLHTVLGLIAPTSGHVRTPGPGSVAYCADTPDFEPWLTAREAVAYSCALAGRGRVDPRSAGVETVLDDVGLLPAADRRSARFSRGMKLRLGIACAVVLEPSVLLLDEPTSALDPVGRSEIIDLIGRLGERMHVLFSSHQLADVEAAADDLMVIDHGRVLFDGPLSDFVGGDDDVVTIEFAEPVPAHHEPRRHCRLDWRRDDASDRIVHVTAPLGDVLPALAPIADAIVDVRRRRASLQDAFVRAVAHRPDVAEIAVADPTADPIQDSR